MDWKQLVVLGLLLTLPFMLIEGLRLMDWVGSRRTAARSASPASKAKSVSGASSSDGGYVASSGDSSCGSDSSSSDGGGGGD